MKINEIMESASVGATSTGSIATVSQPIESALTQSGNKYSKESTPNTPESFKRLKKNVVGRFENSVGH